MFVLKVDFGNVIYIVGLDCLDRREFFVLDEELCAVGAIACNYKAIDWGDGNGYHEADAAARGDGLAVGAVVLQREVHFAGVAYGLIAIVGSNLATGQHRTLYGPACGDIVGRDGIWCGTVAVDHHFHRSDGAVVGSGVDEGEFHSTSEVLEEEFAIVLVGKTCSHREDDVVATVAEVDGQAIDDHRAGRGAVVSDSNVIAVGIDGGGVDGI